MRKTHLVKMSEYISNGTWDDSSIRKLFRTTGDCERFATTRLSVGEYCSIVSAEHSKQETNMKTENDVSTTNPINCTGLVPKLINNLVSVEFA